MVLQNTTSQPYKVKIVWLYEKSNNVAPPLKLRYSIKKHPKFDFKMISQSVYLWLIEQRYAHVGVP